MANLAFVCRTVLQAGFRVVERRMPSASGSSKMVESSPALFLSGFFQPSRPELPQGHGQPHHGAALGCLIPFPRWPVAFPGTAAFLMVQPHLVLWINGDAGLWHWDGAGRMAGQVPGCHDAPPRHEGSVGQELSGRGDLWDEPPFGGLEAEGRRSGPSDLSGCIEGAEVSGSRLG